MASIAVELRRSTSERRPSTSPPAEGGSDAVAAAAVDVMVLVGAGTAREVWMSV
jgi:hypothetical protein